MSRYSAEYRVGDKTFCFTLRANSWVEADFHLNALKINGYFIEKDQIEYNIDGKSYCVECRFFETEEEAMNHLRSITFNAEIVGELIGPGVKIPKWIIPKGY